jgi:hypothetical protein
MYFSWVGQRHKSYLAHNPSSAEIVGTMLEEHELGASAVRQSNPPSSDHLAVPYFDS